jgi:hypothetical protein
MADTTHRPSVTKILSVGAIVCGVAAGSYGIANAASGSGTTSTTTTATPTQPAAPSQSNGGRPAFDPQHPWGAQRSDETLLTGETAAKVTAAAQAEVPGGTIVRVETDADGHALYEAHMTASDGTPTTVYVDKDFNVVSVETR